MIRRPPRSTLHDTRFSDTTLFRSRIGPAEPVARIRTAPERRLAESPARFRATTVAETAPTGCRNQLSHQDQCPCAAGEPWNDAPRHRIGTEKSPQAGRASALGANPREA